MATPGRLAPIGGRASSAWSLLTAYDAEAINDAGAVTTAGTGLVAGTATWVMAGDIVQVDGYQEAWSGWTASLAGLYPDWDDTTDRLDLLLEVAALPLAATKYGFQWGVMDTTYAGRAGAVAVGLGLYPNSTTVTQTTQAGATANGSAANNGTNLNVVTQVTSSIVWDATGAARVTGRTKRTTDTAEVAVVSAATAAMGALANRRIFLGHSHVSTTSGTPTLSARLYHRRVRLTAGPFV